MKNLGYLELILVKHIVDVFPELQSLKYTIHHFMFSVFALSPAHGLAVRPLRQHRSLHSLTVEGAGSMRQRWTMITISQAALIWLHASASLMLL